MSTWIIVLGSSQQLIIDGKISSDLHSLVYHGEQHLWNREDFCPSSHWSWHVTWEQNHNCCLRRVKWLDSKAASRHEHFNSGNQFMPPLKFKLVKQLLLKCSYCSQKIISIFKIIFEGLVFFLSVKTLQTVNHFCSPWVLNKDILSHNLCVKLAKLLGTEIPGKCVSRWTKAGGMAAFTEASTTSDISVQDNTYPDLSPG